jgi:hypothetical protein
MLTSRLKDAFVGGTVESMNDAPGASALTVQLLEWLAERPRSYAETLEAWKTSCPRLTIWDDAVKDRLVRVERGAVVLTSTGALLAQNVESRRPDAIANSTSAAMTIR